MPDSKGLGWIPGPEDPRDKPLGAALGRLGIQKTSGTQFWWSPSVLDQGKQGSCVAHGWVHSVNATPQTHRYDHPFAVGIYDLARKMDEWPGEDYEGTSVRAGAKACQSRGLISSYAFTQDVKEAVLWLLNRRPIVIGVDWYSGMFDAKKENRYFIKPTGSIEGGHCVMVDGVRYVEGGKGSDYLRIQNSWGRDWGYNGRAKISFADFEKLLSEPYAIVATSVEG